MSKAAEAAAAAVAVVRRQAAEQNPSCAPWMPRLECSEDWLCERCGGVTHRCSD